MRTESEVVRSWRQLFRGQAITTQTLAEADLLVEELHLESPLRLRLLAELEEIRNLQLGVKPKKRR